MISKLTLCILSVLMDTQISSGYQLDDDSLLDSVDVPFSLDFLSDPEMTRNCQLNPYACTHLCGAASPDCDMMGHCNCHQAPHHSSQCERAGIEDGKCGTYLCSRKDWIAYSCWLEGDKYCICAPPSEQYRKSLAKSNTGFGIARGNELR